MYTLKGIHASMPHKHRYTCTNTETWRPFKVNFVYIARLNTWKQVSKNKFINKMNQEKIKMFSAPLEFLHRTQAKMEIWEFIVEKRWTFHACAQIQYDTLKHAFLWWHHLINRAAEKSPIPTGQKTLIVGFFLERELLVRSVVSEAVRYFVISITSPLKVIIYDYVYVCM